MTRLRTTVIAMLLGIAWTAGCGSTEKVCAADQRLCANACTSLQSDARNCGACGNVCGIGQGCSAGACVSCDSAPGVCTADVLAACSIGGVGSPGEVRPLASDLTPSGPPLNVDARPISFARAGDTFYVANSTSSSISTIELSPPSATSGAQAIAVSSAAAGFPDLEYLAAHDGLLWTSNAAANTLVVLDPATGRTVQEVALPPGPFGSNPQGLDFVGTKAYLALNGIDAVAVLDVSNPSAASVTKTISLAALAPPGASAMPYRVLASGTRLFVTLNGLDPSTFAPPPGSQGRLAVIDSATDTPALAPVELGPGCLDPAALAIAGTTLWIACGFHDFTSAAVSGASLVPVDVSSATPVVGAPIVLTGHAAGSIAICGGRGYAGATESGTVMSFDPTRRVLLDTAIACPAPAGRSSFVSDLICAR